MIVRPGTFLTGSIGTGEGTPGGPGGAVDVLTDDDATTALTDDDGTTYLRDD